MKTWRTDIPPEDRVRSGAPRWLVVPAGLAVALLGAIVAARVIGGYVDGSDTTGDGSTSVVTAAFSGNGATTTVLAKRPEDILRGSPGMRIHPQRAEAGAPLDLLVEGEGCPGAGGTLSITEVGSAVAVGGVDRLVVRRRFDVDGSRRFEVTPLLVGQPPATYRVAVACDRTARAVAVVDGAGRRDTFVMSELLELVGPATGRDIDVVPAFASPGTATTVQVTARGCPTGRDGRVEVSVFPPNAGAPPAVLQLRATPDAGTWRTTFAVPADAAFGSYTVEARCHDALGLVFPYSVRTVRFGTPPIDDAAPPETSRLRSVLSSIVDVIAPPPKAIPGSPNYTG